MKKIIQYTLFCISTQLAYSQNAFKPDSIKKTIEATEIKGNLKIDGSLDEIEWKQAKPFTNFTMIEPFQGQKPNHQTEVRVLYNKHFLYFSAFCRDSLGKNAIRATELKRDFSYRGADIFAISIDGFNDKRNAMMLMTNPYGSQRDLLSFDDMLFDVDWDGLWRVRTARLDSGWTAEFAVPWQTLRYPKTNSETHSWGINFYRNRRLTNEQTAFSQYPRTFSFLRMDYAGELKKLSPPPPSTNIRFQPYFLTSFDHFSGVDDKARPYNYRENPYKIGGEIKWAINPNAVLDLTYNTDFAQTDLDKQINNTTRFSVFFPEKRQFFLENASLFGITIGQNDDESGGLMRIQPFFSRSIGLASDGNPIPIEVGGRFVYRSEKTNFGGIAIRQQAYGDSPETNFFIGRFSENIGTSGRIGGIITAKNRPDYTNLTGTVDGFFRLNEHSSINSMVIGSHNTNNSGSDGIAAMTQYFYTSNHFKIWWTESLVTQNFNSEVGFTSRKDVVGTSPGIFYYYRGKHLPLKKHLLAYEPSIFADYFHQSSTGKLTERIISGYPIWLNFISGAFFGYGIKGTHQNLLDNSFQPLGINIPIGEYNYVRHSLYFSNDPSKKFSYFGTFELGNYFGGKLKALDFNIKIAPIPHISLITRWNNNSFQDVGDVIGTKSVNLYSVEGRFALNPRVQLVSFYQINGENNQANTNVRLSWEYKPLSYIYLVYNKREFDTSCSTIRTFDEHYVFKVSYLKQF